VTYEPPSFVGECGGTGKILRGCLAPLVRYEYTNDQTLLNGQDYLCLLCLLRIELPSVTYCFVNLLFRRSSIDVNKNCLVVIEDGFFRSVTLDYLFRMHQSSIARVFTTYRISCFGVCIYQGSFDVNSGLLIHAMPMNNMPDFKPKITDFPDSPQLISQVVGIVAKRAFHMVEDSVVLAFAYIEGLAVTWID